MWFTCMMFRYVWMRETGVNSNESNLQLSFSSYQEKQKYSHEEQYYAEVKINRLVFKQSDCCRPIFSPLQPARILQSHNVKREDLACVFCGLLWGEIVLNSVLRTVPKPDTYPRYTSEKEFCKRTNNDCIHPYLSNCKIKLRFKV